MATRVQSYNKTLERKVGFFFTDCPECAVMFAIPSRLEKQRREDKKWFYCPNGHDMAFLNSTIELLQEKLDATKASLAAERDYIRSLSASKEAVEKSLSATKGHLTRAKRRIAAGVCPYCNRNFVALGRHVRGQHPEHADHFRETAE